MDYAHYPKHTRIYFQKTKALKKGIAFFDFDGTITEADSLAEMIRFVHGDLRFWWGVSLSLPMIAGFKAGLVDRQQSKEALLTRFFGGITETTFETTCRSFTEQIIPKIIRPLAATRLHWHRAKGDELVVVSASPEHWLKQWCDEQGMACIATRLEVKNGIITGKIDGRNCHGEEKVHRIRERYDLNQYTDIYAYGDSSGDKPMLLLANHPNYKPFR